MAITKGKRALERLTGYRARNWYTKEFVKFVDRLCDDYLRRSEVVKGGKVSSGTVSATATGITVSNTYARLDGKMYGVSTSSSSLTDVSDKDLANSAGDTPSVALSFATAPTLTGAAANLTVTYDGVSFVARFFDSASGEEYDTSSSADLQIDVDLSTLTAETARDAISGGLSAKFPDHTVADTGSDPYVVTITAPAGHDNFTYTDTGIGGITDTVTDATVEFGGIIYTDGSVASGVDASSNPAYMAVIVTNSDNDGGVLAEGSYAQLMAVVSGSSSALGTDYPTSEEIQGALDASSKNRNGYNHSGYTGWAHIAQVKNDNGTATVVSNINNHKDV